jgi:uncharacterized protein (TIGR02996 family)
VKSEAFIAAIAADPDNDRPRLDYADWLKKHKQPDRAEFIRLSCQLDPIRDVLGDPATDKLRQRVEELLGPDREAENYWLQKLDRRRPLSFGVQPEWRSGFVDTLELPVQWFLEFGAEFRERYPLLRKLVLFRLNGWGERLAACDALDGIREVELPCWYSDADAVAVASSPHLAAVEHLVLWSGGGAAQGRIFAGGSAWPKLREIHLVCRNGTDQAALKAMDTAAGRKVATAYDFSKELLRYPFAADFGNHVGFIVGKSPKGEQLFAWGPAECPTADGWRFRADGTKLKPFSFEFPDELILPLEPWGTPAYKKRQKREDSILAARRQHLAEQTGFAPAFIRVEEFEIEVDDSIVNPSYTEELADLNYWGQPDDPDVAPEDDVIYGIQRSGGLGSVVYRKVKSVEFQFLMNEVIWVCDRRGVVVFT